MYTCGIVYNHSVQAKTESRINIAQVGMTVFSSSQIYKIVKTSNSKLELHDVFSFGQFDERKLIC